MMENITLTISAEHLNIIGAALGELPYKAAAPVVAAIQRQVEEFERKRAETKDEGSS